MKIQVCRWALLAAALACLNSGIAFADGTNMTPTAPAAPGSAEQKDTKTQENNPVGPAKQKTAHPSEKSKHHKHKTHAPSPKGDMSGDKATKTPQKETPPSTPNP